MENIKAAIEGNEEVFNHLYRQYHPIVYKLSKKYYLKGYDNEDWLQEGRISFYHSLKNYQPDRKVTIGKFFKLNFENHISSLVRKQCAYKRTADTMAVSLEQKLENQEGEWASYLGVENLNSLDYMIMREKLEAFPMTLSSFECTIFSEYMNGRELSTIAEDQPEMLNTRSAYDRAKRKLKDILVE